MFTDRATRKQHYKKHNLMAEVTRKQKHKDVHRKPPRPWHHDLLYSQAVSKSQTLGAEVLPFKNYSQTKRGTLCERRGANKEWPQKRIWTRTEKRSLRLSWMCYGSDLMCQKEQSGAKKKLRFCLSLLKSHKGSKRATEDKWKTLLLIFEQGWPELIKL